MNMYFIIRFIEIMLVELFIKLLLYRCINYILLFGLLVKF